MTVLEASERLFTWFAENDYFVIDEAFLQVNPISYTVEKDKGVFELALKDLEQNELISSVDVEDKTCWVLKKPFTAYEQTVTLSPPVAMGLAQVINAACDEFGDDTDYCDPSRVDERDIRNLLLLYGHATNPEQKD